MLGIAHDYDSLGAMKSFIALGYTNRTYMPYCMDTHTLTCIRTISNPKQQRQRNQRTTDEPALLTALCLLFLQLPALLCILSLSFFLAPSGSLSF